MRVDISTLSIGLILCTIPTLWAGEPLPQDFGYTRTWSALIDAGIGWESHSLFHPATPDSLLYMTDSAAAGLNSREIERLTRLVQGSADAQRHGASETAFIGAAGFITSRSEGSDRIYRGTGLTPFVRGHLSFHQYWSADLYLRATNRAASLAHYSGRTRSIERAGFNSAEIDQAQIAFRNDWAVIEAGRSREIVGFLPDENLALGAESPAYDRFAVQATFGRFTWRSFYGFLEAIRGDSGITQRYIAGRTLQYASGNRLLLGFTEVSYLSGRDRPLDWAFINPLGFHVEIDQNHRDNQGSDKAQNAWWVLNADYLAAPRLRLSGAILLDDFQLDAKDRQRTQDQLGWLARAAWSPVIGSILATLWSDYVRIGTFTTQHDVAANNAVTRGVYMGHPVGNDAERMRIGARLIPASLGIYEAAIGQARRGGNSLLRSPYRSRTLAPKVSFPSAPVGSATFLEISAGGWILRDLRLELDGKWEWNTKQGGVEGTRVDLSLIYAHLFIP
ncbi:MAG: hypothetical protein FJY67_07025 [Calditrichaeota bacterium]|nr:hypothetical protein [Calditrichota bacterium]